MSESTTRIARDPSGEPYRCETCGAEIEITPVVVNLNTYCSLDCLEAGT